MPYEWTQQGEDSVELKAWPHQSLQSRGFVLFMAITAIMIALPLVALLGTTALWGLLPFLLITIAAMWLALKRSWRDNSILEVLTLSDETIALERHNPRADPQKWQCQTYWAETFLHPSGGPVPQYLTLRGNGREVELGAFLSAEERQHLYGDLRSRLGAIKKP